jgi:hypothetical protein
MSDTAENAAPEAANSSAQADASAARKADKAEIERFVEALF